MKKLFLALALSLATSFVFAQEYYYYEYFLINIDDFQKIEKSFENISGKYLSAAETLFVKNTFSDKSFAFSGLVSTMTEDDLFDDLIDRNFSTEKAKEEVKNLQDRGNIFLTFDHKDDKTLRVALYMQTQGFDVCPKDPRKQ